MPEPTFELLFGYFIFSEISGLVAHAARHNKKPFPAFLNGCLGRTDRGTWRGVGRKGWQRVGESLAKGWRRGEELAKGWRVSLHPPIFNSKPKGRGEKGPPKSSSEISSQKLADFECRFPYDSYGRAQHHFSGEGFWGNILRPLVLPAPLFYC